MTPVAAFLTDICVSLVLSTVLLTVMARPLHLILKQLCPGTDASVFWLVFTGVMLYLTPLMFAVFFLPTASAAEPVSVIRVALVAASFGAFAALLVIGTRWPTGDPARRRASRARGSHNE
jgi:hypothetical protein